MTTKTIAITGATGQFGAIALNLLKAKNANVIALVRSPEKISGVEARKFDYSKTEGQVEALQGVDTLILVSSNEIGQRFVQHNNVIEAAKKAGVKHIIYTSLLGATNDNTVKSLAGEYVETEPPVSFTPFYAMAGTQRTIPRPSQQRWQTMLSTVQQKMEKFPLYFVQNLRKRP